jgi:MFS family permease
MYGLFTPIYYISQGVPYQRIILYMISYGIGGILSGVFANLLINRFGVKSYILGRGLVEPLSVLMITVYPLLHYPIELQGLISGIVQMGFWVSMDVLTVKTTDKDSRGQQQSNIYSGMYIGGLVAPFLAGLIIKNFGYTPMFITSFFLILIGGIISIFVNLEIKTIAKVNFHPDFKGVFGKHMMLTALRGMTFSMTAWLFPLIIFDYLKDALLLGTFGTVLSVISLISNMSAGFLIDRFSKKAMVAIYTLSFFSWIAAGIFTGKPFLFAIGFITLFYNMISISINTLFFNAIVEEELVSLVSERTIAFCLGSIILLLLHYFFDYKALFFISGISLLGSLVVLKKV